MIKNLFSILIMTTLFLVSAQITTVKPLPSLAQTISGNNHTELEFTFVTKWGSLGEEPGQFDGQNSVAASNDSIYVADYYNERMQMFTPEGEFVNMWGGTYGEADGEFKKPHGVAVDSDGNVYVSERSGLRIQKFDSEGNFITKWGSEGTGDGQFTHLHDIALGPGGSSDQTSLSSSSSPSSINNNQTTNSNNNEFVYTTDAENFNVQKFTTDGEFITTWGSEGTGDGQFGGLESLDVDSEGNVYVADSGNERVQKFTADGEFILSWGTPGAEAGQFDEPGGVAIDSNDNVYVTDIENHRVQVFTSDGEFITQIGSSGAEVTTPTGSGSGASSSCCSEGDADGQFNQPEGVDVDLQNRVIVADTGNNRIQVFEQNPAL
jgi:sugar lactone lactonase YvrE